MIQQPIKNIGWIGTGIMGLSMCKHLLKKGYNLKVYTRTKAKAQPLLDLGVEFVEPKQMAEECDALFLMLGYPKDVEDVVLGSNGVLQHMKPNSFLVDHTTSSPQLAKQINDKAREFGVFSVDAPVSGGDVGAREGRLVIMCGGEQEAFEGIKGVFTSYGTNIQHTGGPGAGQHTKMVNQIVLSGNMIGTVEGLLYGKKAGLNLEQLIETIKTGAASSTAWSVLGGRMIKGDFAPGFYVEHYIKDLEIALEGCQISKMQEAKRANLCLPGLALVKQFYQALVAHGGARMGTQALLLALEKLNNYEIDKRN